MLNIPRDIVNGLNKYFVEVGLNVKKNSNVGGSIYKYLDKRCKNSLCLKESTEFELLNIV